MFARVGSLGLASCAVFAPLVAGLSPVITNGFSVSIDGISYYIPGQPFVSLTGSLTLPSTSEWLPVTVVGSDAAANHDALQSTIDGFGKTDDVWTSSFLSCQFPATSARQTKSN